MSNIKYLNLKKDAPLTTSYHIDRIIDMSRTDVRLSAVDTETLHICFSFLVSKM